MRQLFDRLRPQHATPSPLTCVAECMLPDGWMPGGWGSYRFRFTNGSATTARLLHWAAHWEAHGQPIGQPWSAALDQPIPAHATATKDEVGFLPQDVVAHAHPHAPVMVGQFLVEQGEAQFELPFRLTIPAAVLPEPLRLVRGTHVGLELMASRWTQFTEPARARDWLDHAYALMHDLTGQQPDAGALLVLQESPPHPYFAYAGNPVVLNTHYVTETLHAIEANQMPFGWIHEIGHTFDVLGPWYNWNAAAAEWQANFKLAYVFEHLADQSWTIDWRAFHNASFGHPLGNTAMHGQQFVDALWTFNGDSYLADRQRSWETMSSDELHSCFQRVQRIYGWEPWKRWYRAYGYLAQRGFAPPATSEGKIQLCAAILEQVIEADLLPTWTRWRLPVTGATLKHMTHAYALADGV